MKGPAWGKMTSKLVRMDSTRHRVQTDVSSWGKSVSEGLDHCSPWNLPIPTPPSRSSVCSLHPWNAVPSPTFHQFMSLLLSSLSYSKKPCTLCLRQGRLPPVWAFRDHVAWGCWGPLLELELTEAVFHVSHCSTHMPLSSCNWNILVSRLL